MEPVREKLEGVGHNWVHGDLDATSVKRSARIAVQNTGQTQAVHFHEPGEPCVNRCYTLTERDVEEGL